MLTCLLCGVLDTVSVTRIKPSFYAKSGRPCYPQALSLLEDIVSLVSPFLLLGASESAECVFLSLRCGVPAPE